MTARIDRLWPEPAEHLSDEQLLANYPFPAGRAWLRVNFISSIDGAVTRAGRSGGLGDSADRRAFALLRRSAHAVLVAAGTVRIEGYGAMLLDDADVQWREAHGLSAQPAFIIVSRSLELDPQSAVFTEAPSRPVIYTVDSAPADRVAALAAVADVVTLGEHDVDLQAVRVDLAARGLTHVHSEGGPHLFGALIAAGVVDELCLTVAPTLEGGSAGRIAAAPHAAPTGMQLAAVLRAGDELLLRYTREAQ